MITSTSGLHHVTLLPLYFVHRLQPTRLQSFTNKMIYYLQTVIWLNIHCGC